MQYDVYYDNHSGNMLSAVMRKVYLKMFLGLLVSAATAFAVLAMPDVTTFIATHKSV